MVTLIVDDYDKAINYYVDALGFHLIEDSPVTQDKRWVVVAPDNKEGCNLLLAKAGSDFQSTAIGNQFGGRVGLFLHTDDFEATYKKFIDKGVQFIEEPRTEHFGKVVIFEDIYGLKWDLVSKFS